jgi:glucose/arabinose dehydrogenase
VTAAGLGLLVSAVVLPLFAEAAHSGSEQPSSYGPSPSLPAPQSSLVPTLKSSLDDEPWPAGASPKAAAGLAVAAFARDLKHPRWLYLLPNGDVLVAESATEPEAAHSITAWIENWLLRRSGAIAENANRITLLRDTDGDGVAEARYVFLQGLRQPFGMALIGNTLYVANTDSVVRFPYLSGETKIEAKGTKIADLPVGHHWTRNLLASSDGSKLYVTVGSGSNVADNGIENEVRRADILEIDLASGSERVFASGLRNPNGMAFEPTTGVLWTVVNERDLLGDDVPPDYLTSVKDGGFYGWPYSYWGPHVDSRVEPQRPDLVARAIIPDYALGAHTASLGLAFSTGDALPAPYRNGAFIGQHGSWNRSSFSGYQVLFVPFKDGRPDGQPLEVLTGFLKDDGSGRAYGRPVGVALDRSGALLVADDTGNAVWRVTAAHP